MSWSLVVDWEYRVGSPATLDEEFDTKAEGITRAAEVMADGYTISTPSSHEHYPAAAIRHISLIENAEA
jgi:hypothetical protein